MKYGVKILITLLILSLGILSFNYYNYKTQYNKNSDISDKMNDMNRKIEELNTFIDKNKNSYDEFVNNNKNKIEYTKNG